MDYVGGLQRSTRDKWLLGVCGGIARQYGWRSGYVRLAAVVLAVGAAWLPLSSKQADYTNALAKKYAGRNVAFYFVATDSANSGSKNFTSTDDIRKFVATNKLGMTILRDPEGTVTRHKYDIDQFPSFVILDKTGAQSGESIGGVDSTGKYDLTVPLSKAIDRLL